VEELTDASKNSISVIKPGFSLAVLICCGIPVALVVNLPGTAEEAAHAAAAQHPGHLRRSLFPRFGYKKYRQACYRNPPIQQFLKYELLQTSLQSTGYCRTGYQQSLSRYLATPAFIMAGRTSSQYQDGGMLVPAMMFDSTRPPNPMVEKLRLLIKLIVRSNVTAETPKILPLVYLQFFP